MNYYAARGSGKTTVSFFAWIESLYKEGKIAYMDYLALIAGAKINLLHQDEKDVKKWVNDMLDKKK